MTARQNKVVITVALVAVILLFSLQSEAAGKTTVMKSFSNLNSKYGAARVAMLGNAYDALQAAQFPPQKIKLALAQVMLETGVFGPGSHIDSELNNYSGIMWINKPAVQLNATKGLPFPKKEGNYFYAHFKTPADWARDYLRIINRPPNYPINATSPADFAKRLKDNKYYTSSLIDYTKNVSYFYNLLTSLGF